MSIEQLIYFTKVCENKSFTKTSKELFISQPAITTAIKNLEKEFKTELITMNGKNLEITPSGERLYSLAIPIITLYNNLENQMHDFVYKSTTIKIGIPPMLGTFIFAPLFDEFLIKYPNVNLKLYELASHANKTALLEGEIDIALTVIYNNEIEDNLDFIKIGQADLVFAVNKNHPFATKKEISIKELGNTSLILFKEDSLQYQVITKLFNKANVTPIIKLKSEQLSTIKELLSYGTIGAFLFKQVIKENDDIIGIPLEGNLSFDIVLATRKNSKFNKLALDLLKLIKDYSNEKIK